MVAGTQACCRLGRLTITPLVGNDTCGRRDIRSSGAVVSSGARNRRGVIREISRGIGDNSRCR